MARELLAMARADQEVRRAWQRDQERSADVERLDHDHTEALREMVDAVGWPGRSMVGEAAATAAWLIVQHADHDPAFQRRCLALLEKAAENGEAEPRLVAFLTDRVLIHEGNLQRYGTQLRMEDGRLAPIAIEDPDGVDERREAVGLEPLQAYVQQTERSYGVFGTV
jgi:hypothetical protein